ncbi:MAG: gluconate 2-dehydrogenase subunit 3 family protein [Actinomycetota bacterium]
MVKSSPMPDPASIDAIRAAVDVMLPATDDGPGGVALEADRHVAELAEGAMPGSVDLIAALLNAYAEAVRPGIGFAGLTREEREQVLKTMLADPSQDIRTAVDTIQVFALGATYSEWSGFDPASRSLTPPPTWAEVGYRGPVRGWPVYREDPA